MSIRMLIGICSLLVSCLSCENNHDVPARQFRTKSIAYQKLRYGSYYGQLDVFIYNKSSNMLDSSKGDVFVNKDDVYIGKRASIRSPITNYIYDNKGRLASFDYRFYQQLNILYKLGFVRSFTYNQDGSRVMINEVNHDPSLNNYVYKLDFNLVNQLVKDSIDSFAIGSYIYQDDNLVQEDRIIIGVKARYIYEYDNKPNPFYHLEGYPEYLTNWRKYSKNNLKKVTIYLFKADGNTIQSTSSFENILTYDENGLLMKMAGGDQSYYNTYWDYQEFLFTYEPY